MDISHRCRSAMLLLTSIWCGCQLACPYRTVDSNADSEVAGRDVGRFDRGVRDQAVSDRSVRDQRAADQLARDQHPADLPPALPLFDAATSKTANSSADRLEWRHTTGAGRDRLLLVMTAVRGAAKAVRVTYDGTLLTYLRSDQANLDARTEIWYLVAPAVGAKTIVVSFDKSQSVTAGATSWSGVDPKNPFETNGGATASSDKPTAVTLTTRVGQLVVDVVATQYPGSKLVADSAQTVRWKIRSPQGEGGSSSLRATSSATKMSWDDGLGLPHWWAMSAVALRPAP